MIVFLSSIEWNIFLLDERRRREESQRFESRLEGNFREHERLQNDYRILSEETQRKRRALHDLENELRNKARKQAEQHARLERDTDLTRAEYYSLKDELDKMAYTLRFSVEEELKIYEALLNSLHRKKEDRPAVTTRTTRVIDTFSSGGESTGFHRSQPNLSETTRILTTHREDSSKYRTPSPLPPPPPRPPPPPLLTETSRTFTVTKPDETMKYRPTPLLSETTMTSTTMKRTKQQTDDTIPIIRIDQVNDLCTEQYRDS